MALVKCSECGKEISDKATTCPSCGNPILTQTVVTDENKKVEIVLTSKKWKKTSMWGMTFAILGFIVWVRGSIEFGILFFFIAFVLGMISRIGAWWTNG